ncbi:class I SAM-dependent methyltransferase [Paenibacillus sp. BAC0078]
MDIKELKKQWLQEEQRVFKGWDFSSLDGRMAGDEPPWSYEAAVRQYINDKTTLLDMGTGGGEFLLSLEPPRGKTFATEAYPPNYELCKKLLPPYGIEVRQVFSDDKLPFEDGFFDVVINRHESFSIQEVYRILKPGGVFVTQQVGGQNNRALSEMLLGGEAAAVDEAFYLDAVCDELRRGGFTVSSAAECFPELRFYDIGALVYFAKIIEWEFPGFTVEKCFDRLCLLQQRLAQEGCIRSTEHRFFITAGK